VSPSSHLSFSRKPFSLEHMHVYGADTLPLSISDGYSSVFTGRNDANPATHTFVASPDIVTAMASTGNAFQGPCRHLAIHFGMLFLGGVKRRGRVLYSFTLVSALLLFLNPNHTYISRRCQRSALYVMP
jgi:hypothetical protein